MKNDYAQNQEVLNQKHENGFGGGNDIQRRAAEQRSNNEQNINNSAEEITKKSSTVQASSDMLKGDNDAAKGRFAVGHTNAKIDQQTPLIDRDNERQLQKQLEELRKKQG